MNRLLVEVRSGDRPVFCIFHEVSGDQPGVGLCAGEYPYHTGTAVNLPVQPFQHVGGRNLSCVQLWKSIKRQRVLQAVFQVADGFGETALVLPADFFGQSASRFPGGGQPDAFKILAKLSLSLCGICARILRIKCTLHRCQLAPGKPLRMAATRPACASETTNRGVESPRSCNPRKS